MKRNPIFALVALIFVVCTTNAVAGSYRWTPTKAEIRVKATYRTPDTSPGHANPPPPAVVQKATCTGVGKPVNHRYTRFHCTAEMIGWGEYATDGFHAKHKLTVTVTGSNTFRWKMGWG